MSSHNEGDEDWVNKIKGKVKLDDDDLGCGCALIVFSAILIGVLYAIIPAFLSNWERPVKVGDFGRAFVVVVLCAATFLPVWLVFFESKDPFGVKIKQLFYYVVWLVAVIYILEYCLNAKDFSLSELFKDGSFRYLR